MPKVRLLTDSENVATWSKMVSLPKDPSLMAGGSMLLNNVVDLVREDALEAQEIQHIPRALNMIADRCATTALETQNLVSYWNLDDRWQENQQSRIWTIASDGGARPNPGNSGAGVSVWCDGILVCAFGIPLGWGGNNSAELSAAIHATRVALLILANCFTFHSFIRTVSSSAENRMVFLRFINFGTADA